MLEDPRWKLFQCQRCGKCCDEIGLPYDGQRLHEIASFLNLTNDEVIEKYYGRFTKDRKHWISEDRKRTPCPFITTNGNRRACAIYLVRPHGCRCYPFETDFGCQGVDCPGADLVKMKYGAY